LNTDLESTPPQYSWDWGGFPTATPTRSSFSHKREDYERATSLPPLGENPQEDDDPQQEEEENADIHFGRGGRLTPGGEQGYTLEFKGRTTVFDLSLCGDLSERSEEEAKALFQERRVPFEKFIDDPTIVHKDELTIEWHGRYEFHMMLRRYLTRL
jgi:phosphatidate phosphatase LPIN